MDLAKIKVRIELEVDVIPKWGRGHEMGQVADQAIQSAIHSVSSHLKSLIQAGFIKVIGKPEAFAVMLPIGGRER